MSGNGSFETHISVCLPVHNRGKTLARALESVTEQTKSPFEVIICDFSSTDDSREIIDNWISENDSRLKINYYQFDFAPNGADDWNKTIAFASGKYISILEGDDVFDSEHLAAAHFAFQTSPEIGLVIFPAINEKGFKSWSESGLIAGNIMLEHFGGFRLLAAPSQAIFCRLNGSNVPFSYNDSVYQYAPEMDLYLRIMKSGKSAFIIDSAPVYRGIGNRKRVSRLYYMDHFHYLERFVMMGHLSKFSAVKTLSKLSLTLHMRAIIRLIDGSHLGSLSDLFILSLESIYSLSRMVSSPIDGKE